MSDAWQDISTAPKDGETCVLTYRKVGLMAVAVWIPEGWNKPCAWCCTDGCFLLEVTHWQPLPEPPPAPLLPYPNPFTSQSSVPSPDRE